MSTAIAEEIRRVHDAGLPNTDIARATGADITSVSAWQRGARQPTGVRRERVIELSEIVRRLERVISLGHITLWLARPNEALDDERPLDLIAAGQFRRVAQVVAQIESDSFS